MKSSILMGLVLVLAAGVASAAGNAMPTMPGMSGMADMGAMPSATDLIASMSGEGSGTAWIPDSSPMYGKMIMKPNGDMLMVHGAIMPRYTDVGSRRGDRRIDAPNWAMGMFSRPIGSDAQLGLRAMVSLDPLTEGGYGYPLLFQTGETWHGAPLHDRQHPHDLIDELSATYSRRIGASSSGYVYLAYPGEPALGPPTYMHRLLAYDLADAPIGHHWQDAAHITFGVATAGYDIGGKVKLEASTFTGREPNENRYGFDRPRFDSRSARVSWSPDSNDAFQVSYGYVKNPEGDGANVHRTTASWVYNRPLVGDSNFTTALVWGRNDLDGEGITDSFLAEADYQRGVNTAFTRMEWIQKSGRELVLPAPFDLAAKYQLGAFTFGAVHDIRHGGGIDTGIGAAVTVNTKPSSLDAFYGPSDPVEFQVYLRFRPSRMGGKHRGNMAATLPASSGSQPAPKVTAPAATPSVAPAAVAPAPTAPAPAGVTAPVPAPVETQPAAPAPPIAPAPSPTQPAPTPAPAAPPAAVTIAKITAAITPNPPKPRVASKLVLTVTGSDGNPVIGALIKASLAMTDMDMGTSHPAVKEIGNGQYAMSITFAMSGGWRVTVSALAPGTTKPFVAKFDFAAGK